MAKVKTPPATRNAITLCFPAFSGGMGKTTVAYLFALYLADKGYRVLGVDADPQANLTLYLGVALDPHDPSLLELLRGELSPGNPIHPLDAIYNTPHSGLDLIPTDKGLVVAQSYLSSSSNPAVILKKRLQAVFAKTVEEGNQPYDFCVVDSPPEGFHLSMTAIGASDFLVIPTLTKSKGTNSLDITLATIDEMVEMDAFQGTVLGIAPFQDRWVGDNQTKSSRRFFETLPAIAPDIPVFPSLRHSEEIPKLIDEGKSLASLSPPATVKGVVKYHPVYLFEAIFAEIESQCQSQNKPLPTPQTAS